MAIYLVLWIKEHQDDKLDQRICILYDKEMETYYYYGTRNNEGQNTFVNYNGSYQYNQWSSFLSFLSFIMNSFRDVITTELHSVYIPESEYSTLNYVSLVEKLGKSTLMAGYDKTYETVDSVAEYLDMLISK